MANFSNDVWMASTGAASFYPHTIDQSLRFEDGDSPYLNRTFSSGNQQTWTWSAWVKRGNFLGNRQTLFAGRTTGTSNLFGFFNPANNAAADTFGVYLGANEDDRFQTTRVFRDPNAWYHLVVVLDTTNGTAGDRFRLYVNGVRETVWTRFDTITQNQNKGINENLVHTIGEEGSDGNHFDGYMSEVNFIDGTALGPDSFGETKDGVWIPKDASGLTFGTNGFHLPFAVTQGDSAFFDGSGDSLAFVNSSHYDIASDDDFTVEFFFNHTTDTHYGDFLGNYATAGPHLLLGFDNRTEKDFYFYTGNGQAIQWQLASNSGIVAGTWHHIVFQRNGTVLRCYLDGVRQTNCIDAASNTGYTISGGNVTDFNKAYDLANIELGSPTAADFDGFLSNVRLVIGASVYANDDNNITVPTATLTNVSGTALLALTTSTITKDSSDNDVTGTVGSSNTVYRQNNPFSTIIGKDAAGSNNFASSGLAFTDVVLDSPTNGFPTANPLAKSSMVTLSEGNLKVAGNSASNSGNVTVSPVVTSGKWYFEYLVAKNDGDTNYPQIAAYRSGLDEHRPFINGGTGTGGQVANFFSLALGLTNGDILGIAVDADGGTVKFYDNNSYISGKDIDISAYDSTGIWIGIGEYNTGFGYLNFGQDSSFAGNKTAQGNGEAHEDFFYTPPTGYKGLNLGNFDEPAIIDGSEYFTSYLYTANNASTRDFTGIGFAPNFLWFKNRPTGFSHALYDTVRGVNKGLQSNGTGAENSYTLMTAFGDDGFSTANDGTAGNLLNYTTDAYVAWAWKAGTAVSGNTSGSGTAKAYSGSVSAESGFSIITYKGNGTAGHTIPHNLNAKPSMVLFKNRDVGDQWAVYHKDILATHNLSLNLSDAKADQDNRFNDTEPTSSVITLGTGHVVNATDEDYIAYCFTDIDQYCKAGVYIGNANPDGPYVNLGFRPAFLLIKRSDSASHWVIIDTKRSPFNEITAWLAANLTNTESSVGTNNEFDILSNGFKNRNDAGADIMNQSGASYTYLAFAEQPAKYSNAR
jgi:hypothetical protein